MKKLVTLLLALVATTALWAEDFSAGGIYYNILTDKTNEVAVTYRGSSSGDYNEYSGSVTIPSTVTYGGKTYSVTSIGEAAFEGCSRLTSVTIGNSVTSIGNYAFMYCESLTSITIPNSVTSIGGSAFWGCSGLTSITIPNSVTSIGSSAFEYCSRLTSVTIGNSVTSIGEGAFEDTGIYNDDWNWENGVLYISNCLIEVKPDQVAATYTIKDGTRLIANAAFTGCSGLTSITIPNSVTSIGERVFYNCSSLTSVTIGNSVTSIGEYAFYKCTALTSVTIPNSVTSIGEGAFAWCSGLTSITSLAEIPPTLGSNAFYSNAFYNVSTSIPVYVPCGSVSAYQSAEGWNAFTNIQCGSNEPSTDLENTHSPSPMTNCQKVIRDGQLIILRDGKTYNAMGQEL